MKQAALERLQLYACALWWGSLSAIGFLVVPLLFAHLPTPAQAGTLAARLFTAQTWVSVGCGIVLLMAVRGQAGEADAGRSPTALLWICGGLMLALLGEFAVAPRIVARENLKLWHGVGSAMYLLQWMCAGVLLWQRGARQR